MVAGEWRELEYNVSQFGVQEDEMKSYVPRGEITTIPPGWNEAGSFDFLNDSSQDIYTLEDGEEI